MRRIAGPVALLALVAATGFWWTRADPSKDDPKLFANRIWAERDRRDDRDLVLYFMPIEVGSKRGGTMTRSSRYAFAGEVFRWSRDGANLKLELPQSQRTVALGVRTWSCAGEAPKGFDLCLELTQGKDKLQLYSRKGWKIPRGEDLPIPVADVPDLPACSDCTEGSFEELLTPGR